MFASRDAFPPPAINEQQEPQYQQTDRAPGKDFSKFDVPGISVSTGTCFRDDQKSVMTYAL